MEEHPIQGLMTTAMENLRDMIEVNTIVGDPVESPDGSIIIPVSKLGFGFAAGGSEFSPSDGGSDSESQLPFGGGSGGGVSITPIAFLILGKEGIKMVHLDQQTHLYEKLLNQAPQVFQKIQEMLKDSGISLQNGKVNKEEKAKKESESGDRKKNSDGEEESKSKKDDSINYDI